MMAAKDDYQEFRNALNDLKMNSKPLINTLTILAEKKIHHAQLIVRAIEERILETRTEYILPALYVLDSIVKNLRSTIYVQLFETKLPVLFSVAFHKVDEDTRSAMFKLRKTWTPFFTNLCLYNLDARTHDIDPAWPITARVPDPPPFSQDNSNINNDHHQQQSMTDHIRQQNDSDSTVFRTRTVNQPPISIAPPKLSELTSRADMYHMIPLDRMERIRQETAHVLDIGVDGEQQSKIKKTLGKKKKNKKRRPSTRLRRRVNALLQATVNQNNDDESSDDDDENSDGNENDEKQIDDDNDDEPFIIKQSTALENGFRIKPPENFQINSTENLFGNTDKDYRESESTTNDTTSSSPPSQTKLTKSIPLDADSIFEINSKCLSLAEQKYKSNELSPEEYHATLKLLQNILESEVKRLTVPQNNSSSIINNTNNQQQQSNNPLPSHPFQQQLLQFTQQHAPQTTLTPSPTFSMSGFGMDAYRHVMQILATVGAPLSYISHYNFFPFLPPVPPAPAPPPPLFSSSISNDRHSPPPLPIKRLHDENHLEEENKRPRYDPVTGRETKIRNYDEENIAPVPSLLEANINMLKKRYIGIVQQLYAGKDQCVTCGLRFTARQKQAYALHLDWHFVEKKQENELKTNKTNILQQRTQNWYPSVQEWTIYEENLEEQIRLKKLITNEIRTTEKDDNKLVIEGENTVSANGIISCPATGNDDRCFVCHDPFENFFDDNREEWHLKDAIRVDEKTYHPICYQDVQYETIHEKPSINEHLSTDNSTKPILDETSDSTTSEVIPNDSSKVDTNQSIIESQIESDESTENEQQQQQQQQQSSLVDIIETLFMKKDESLSNSDDLLNRNRDEIEPTVDPL